MCFTWRKRCHRFGQNFPVDLIYWSRYRNEIRSLRYSSSNQRLLPCHALTISITTKQRSVFIRDAWRKGMAWTIPIKHNYQTAGWFAIHWTEGGAELNPNRRTPPNIPSQAEIEIKPIRGPTLSRFKQIHGSSEWSVATGGTCSSSSSSLGQVGHGRGRAEPRSFKLGLACQEPPLSAATSNSRRASRYCNCQALPKWPKIDEVEAKLVEAW